MHRFFFHLHSDEVLRDELGQEFTDPAAARAGAIQGISELIAENLVRGDAVDLAHRLEIVDERDAVVDEIVFARLFTYQGDRFADKG